MREAWHPLGGADDGPTPMALSDRRNAALVRLTHRASGAIVWVCAAHLMTTSRDGARTNRYPGEVRAGEFVALRSSSRARCAAAAAAATKTARRCC